ncbi:MULTISPECIES: MFS transporter [unclassified Streptomyces]|uniref:MFS transporter n=1 Tax=unclassified Streptomyces TaxID=2593676 RepID=UPI002E0E0AFD|nr:MFS transporter [Streptomyces sp. NBC_01197]WSS52199.1 MFS transporter [Streptomyces sp. NBC_01180]
MDDIDLSDVGVALPTIQRDLGMASGSLQWVVSAYPLGYGGFLPLGGRVADLFGRRGERAGSARSHRWRAGRGAAGEGGSPRASWPRRLLL